MTLGTALAIAAGVVLLGLALHALWSVRRGRVKRLDAETLERTEPPLHADVAPALAEGAPAVQPRRRSAKLDALIDVIVPLTMEAPVSGDIAAAHLPASRRAGAKPMFIEGLTVDTAEWETPTPGAAYGEFQAGVQLANRSGALNEIEYSEFVQKVQDFADGVGALPDFPDMLDVIARARELDGFASPLDAQLTLNLRANSVAWSVAYVQQTAARHGFVPGALPGRLVLPAAEEGAPPVLVLGFDAQTALSDDPQNAALREVDLSLDVPQTAEAAEPFPAWHRAATGLAEDLDATAVDSVGAPVSLHAFNAIGKELASMYQTLESRDLAAGSVVARRLFS